MQDVCLAELPTAIFFPAYSIGKLLITTVASVFLFHEKISKCQTVGIVTGLLALMLISGIF